MERLADKTQTVIYRQQRVPDDFSGSEEDHQWHATAQDHSIVVDDMSPGEIFNRAQKLLEAGPHREDTEYRVVLVVGTNSTWVL